MDFISPRLIIENLLPIDLQADPCSDQWRLLCICQGYATVTAGETIYRLQEGAVLLAEPRTFCAVQENGLIMSLSFSTNASLIPGGVYLKEEQLPLLDQISRCKEPVLLYPLVELLLHYHKKEPRLEGELSRDTAIYARCAAILVQNVQGQIAVPALAEQLGISLSHLKRVFAQYVGMGVHDYFNLLKISRAKEFLRQGETVTRTAELAGFANQAYFSAAFKRIAGVSPKEYSGSVKQRGARKTSTQRNTPIRKKTPAKPTASSRRDLPSYLL